VEAAGALEQAARIAAAIAAAEPASIARDRRAR
jgi:hypothetical protein